jgi:hypothetical protein
MRAIDDTLRPFFASWTTSLIGSDLDKLQSLSEDRHIRGVLKKLIIEDDSAKLDAWTIGAIPSPDLTYNIWPRNDAGIGLGSDAGLGVGISTLARMLRKGLLQPTQITIRDYRIAADNLQLSPETDQIRETVVVELPESAETVSITSLAEDLVDCGNLDVTSFKVGWGDKTCADLSTLFEDNAHRCSEGTFSISSPSVRETSFELSGIHDNKDLPFSRLHTADAVLDPDSVKYWLEQLFYNAIRLQTLRLCVKGPWPSDSWFDTRRVVPKLVELNLNGTHTGFSADNLLAMLSASKESLEKIQLHNVRLVGESSWREVFPKIASACPNLVSFYIGRVHEDGLGERPIKFPGIKTCIPEEYRPGLTLLEKGHVYNRRMFSVDYEGPHAGKILENLALCVAAATPDPPSDERCSCPTHRQYTSF